MSIEYKGSSKMPTFSDTIKYNGKNKFEICEFLKGMKFETRFNDDDSIDVSVGGSHNTINLVKGDTLHRDGLGGLMKQPKVRN